MIDAPTPDEWKAYKLAYRSLIEASPDLADVPDDHPVILVDEAAMNWARESFDASVRLGDKIESHLREWIGSIGGER